MSKSSPRVHLKPPSSPKEIIDPDAKQVADLEEPDLQLGYWGELWAFRIAMLAVLGATLLLWTIVIFDFFAGMARGPVGPGAGRLQ
jgi:hypothetical protein